MRQRFAFNSFSGMGFWTRANPEVCLLATRGKRKRQAGDVRKLLISPRREHSRKPDEQYEMIEGCSWGPYLELFGRGVRDGWTVWGNQADADYKPDWTTYSYNSAAAE